MINNGYLSVLFMWEVIYLYQKGRNLISSIAVTVLKFGHMNSDLLAYGASDGTLTVCTVADPPSVIKHLKGHSKDVTGWTNWYCFFCLICVIG